MSTKVTVLSIAHRKCRKGAEPLVMVTAYDTPFARLVDDAGVDIILVGDSVANAVLGLDNTLTVTVDDMVHHSAAVARAHPSALVVADLPWMSYHIEVGDAVRNAARLIRAGANAVKLEGGERRTAVIEALRNAEIPVMGHLGLTPQSVNAMGGLHVQAKDIAAFESLQRDARAITHAGCFAVVLEGIPDVVAARITEMVDIPTIGIGAGLSCDGQVLVLHDLLGLSSGPSPKFVRRYADLATATRDAVAAFALDVRSLQYPTETETYHASAELQEVIGRSDPSAAS